MTIVELSKDRRALLDKGLLLVSPGYHSIMKNDQQKPRSVRFLDTILVRETLHINNFTVQERQDSWYDSSEYSDMRNDTNVTVALIKFGKHNCDTSPYCQRGLENRIGKDALRRNRLQLLGLISVLKEQSEQTTMNAFNPDAIADAYAPISKYSSKMAYKLGLRDELEAIDMLHYSGKSAKKVKTSDITLAKKFILTQIRRALTMNKK
jgi:hypothetical protein